MVITDRRATGGRSLAAVVRGAVEGGARLVQLREKDLDGKELLALAREIRSITTAGAALFLVNDRIDVALAAGADGVVLPADSFPTDAARRLVGPDRILGRSTHSVAEVENAAKDGCSFAIFGPVYETPSKAAHGEPQGTARLREACRTKIPVFAIGGIGPRQVADSRAAGAHGIAVIRAIMAAADPARATTKLVRELAKPG